MSKTLAGSLNVASRSRHFDVSGLSLHVREWRTHGAQDDAPVLFMLHGWMDASASFQFVVNALAHPWRVVAPDWRGFGRSGRSTLGPGAYGYWYPEYFADLEALLELHGVGDHAPAHLIGHSMGANIAGAYAGVRPRRVASLVMLEGFGLHASTPEEAPARFARWLDQLHAKSSPRDYALLADLAGRMRKNNPRLSDERALQLAKEWAIEADGGGWTLRADPAHQRVNPYLYRVDEMAACWKAIEAPVLWVEGVESDLLRNGDPEWRAELDRRMACIREIQVERIAGAGHMLHHDQPERVASSVEAFVLGLRRSAPC